LQDAVGTVKTELKVTRKLLGVNWNGKVVRGAYMDRERQVAAGQGKPSPICDNYQLTSDSYNK
jgi:Proline dehydrogenase